ncbi:MAG: hypothetical protein LC804_26010 [Acidobacteria bacterium]|nr:hypothetical protein [Acidobacteriota bacterium]
MADHDRAHSYRRAFEQAGFMVRIWIPAQSLADVDFTPDIVVMQFTPSIVVSEVAARVRSQRRFAEAVLIGIAVPKSPSLGAQRVAARASGFNDVVASRESGRRLILHARGLLRQRPPTTPCAVAAA